MRNYDTPLALGTILFSTAEYTNCKQIGIASKSDGFML